jgi:hypothetical protein
MECEERICKMLECEDEIFFIASGRIETVFEELGSKMLQTPNPKFLIKYYKSAKL